jgi:hypothetical protein
MTKSTDDHASGQEKINERLHQALDELRKDVTRVEIWATALGTFAKPVPRYRQNEKFRLGKTAPEDPESGSV